MAFTDIGIVSRTWVGNKAKKEERSDINESLAPNSASEKTVKLGPGWNPSPSAEKGALAGEKVVFGKSSGETQMKKMKKMTQGHSCREGGREEKQGS